MNARLLLVLAAVLLLLGLAGCGDDDDDEAAGGSTAPAEVETATETAAEPEPATKPDVSIPSGAPPAGLQIEDIEEGEGTTAQPGDSVTVHYVGVAWSTREQFDASWDSGAPFPFTLGSGEVIPGWDQGVAGMQEGGRRRLVIPPELAYGEQGRPPEIPPNETLVFVVDLLRVGG